MKKAFTWQARCLHSVCAAATVLIAHCPVASAKSFIPDRAYFFEQCSTMTNFVMAGPDKAARQGTTRIADNMRTAIARLFDTWEREGDTDKRRLAFILATARRESMSTWRPVREAPQCGEDETCRERVIGTLLAARAARNHTAVPVNYALPAPNGRRYYGRGYIQLTFQSNYERADRLLGTGTELRDDPDKVMELATAEVLLVRGMLLGWFGNHEPLSSYLGDGREDWIGARKNVNPGSPNKPITAESAKEILGCLRSASDS